MTDIIEISRHGNVIPRPGVALPSFRIADYNTRQNYDGYVVINHSVSMNNIFDLFNIASTNKEIVYVLLDPTSDYLLSLINQRKPGNLKTLSFLTGIETESIEESADLIEIMINRHGFEFILSSGFNSWESARFHKIVERQLRKKNNLDNWFYHIPSGTSSLHLKAMDARPDRKIVGFDFNSMYSSTFSEVNYPLPSRLLYSKDGVMLYQKCLSSEIAGAFICEISGMSDFMNNCLMVTTSYGHYSVKTKLPNVFIMVLHANEIDFWKDHSSINIIEGVYSTVLIEHPLRKLSESIYQYRLNSDGLSKKLAKQELLLMHSSTNRNFTKEVNVDIAVKKYGFRFDDIFMDEKVKVHNLDSKSNIYSLQKQVLANSRVKLWKTILDIKNSVPEAELCYANVDSLHYSISSELLPKLLSNVKTGNQMGQLKQEFIGEKGLWLDAGRWWIKVNSRVSIFRSGSKRLSPDFTKMNLHLKYVKDNECELHYLVDKVDYMKNAQEMSKYLSLSTNETFKKSHDLWRFFMNNEWINGKGSA